jgi:5-methyltetrahydropteroyltriglutamate--homocysteine methyltransferase
LRAIGEDSSTAGHRPSGPNRPKGAVYNLPTMNVAAYQPGTYPRSEDVVAATRGLERGRVAAEEVDAAFDRDRAACLAAQRGAGLDLLSDGLLRWQDLFRPLVEASRGMSARTLVRWFDNNTFYRAPEVTEELGVDGPPPELGPDPDIREPRVATLPSPYLFSRVAHGVSDRDAFMREFAREVLAPVARELSANGYRVLHLQEPWLAYFGIDEPAWTELEKALAEVHDALGSGPDRPTLVLHTFFGDAAPHADRLQGLPVDAVGIDLVQTDTEALGRWSVGLLAGALDGRSSLLEPAEATAEIVAHLAEQVDAPAVYVSSCCELEFLPTVVAEQKVARLGEVAALLRERLT